MSKLLVTLAAILALVPAALWPLRRADALQRPVFGLLLGVAVAGPAAYVANQFLGQWHSGLAATIWVSVTASVALFAVLAMGSPAARGLAPLACGYLALFAALGSLWTQAPAAARPAVPVDALLALHIGLSVLAYALATLAAVAGAAVVIKQGALKRKRPGPLSRVLPAVAEAERLQVRLLGAAGAVLGIDIVSGMITQYVASGVLLPFAHKPLFALLAFGVIAVLLVLHWRTGARGRGVARLVLLAYLLLTLGYPGVKFVTDVVLA